MNWLRCELALGLVSLANELRLVAYRLLRCAYWLAGSGAGRPEG